LALTLDVTVVPDPEGRRPGLRLTGDWVFVRIGDGSCAGLGEATHSGDDDRCRRVLGELFDRHVRHLDPTLGQVRELETGPCAEPPDFVHATVFSAVNQALIDLAARRAGVPVWRLFRDRPAADGVDLYATINRCLRRRDLDDYRAVVSLVRERGFRHYKCAPFDAVTGGGDAVKQSRPGLETLRMLAETFPELSMRVDCHARFSAEAFFEVLPELLSIRPYWIEEPFPAGPRYREVRESARVAAGELLFGSAGFRPLVERGWADVILPDVKHVGGFGPLLEVCRLSREHGVAVSPHNPSGPVTTMASLHAAAVFDNVTSLEVPFDRAGGRARWGEPVREGRLLLPEGPGWGIDLPGGCRAGGDKGTRENSAGK
jgi:galactonate dehydratase